MQSVQSQAAVRAARYRCSTHARPWRVGQIAPELLEQAAAPGISRVIRALNPRSAATVPLRTRNHTLGSLVVYWAETPRRYEESDIPLFEELAKRAAIAIENARLYEREREVATEFQRAALPNSLPEVPGIRFHGSTFPAARERKSAGIGTMHCNSPTVASSSRSETSLEAGSPLR